MRERDYAQCTGTFGAIASAGTGGTRGGVLDEDLAAAPDTALHGD